jgi:hypothetical protein
VLERLKIFEFFAPYNFVLFDHNPEQLKMGASARGGTRSTPTASPSGNAGASGNGTEQTTVTVTKARLVGPETKKFCDTLIAWCAPASLGSKAAATVATGQPWGSKPSMLLMQWGPPAAGFTFTATMSKVDIQYLRVSFLGIPTHATVTLALKEEPTILPMTNPTSGGRPGRNRHMMLADETLMSVATKTFGNPSAWRAIAEVNGIDDPTSLRPGDIVYLPAPDELKQLAGATR